MPNLCVAERRSAHVVSHDVDLVQIGGVHRCAPGGLVVEFRHQFLAGHLRPQQADEGLKLVLERGIEASLPVHVDPIEAAGIHVIDEVGGKRVHVGRARRPVPRTAAAARAEHKNVNLDAAAVSGARKSAHVRLGHPGPVINRTVRIRLDSAKTHVGEGVPVEFVEGSPIHPHEVDDAPESGGRPRKTGADKQRHNGQQTQQLLQSQDFFLLVMDNSC